MGESKKAEQVSLEIGDNMLLLLSVTAEIRPFLEDFGLDFHDGIIIFCENNRKIFEVKKFLIEIGEKYVKTLTESRWKVQNNQIGLHIYEKYEKEPKILNLLQVEDFTPIILTGCMMPDFLSDWPNQITFEGDTEFHADVVREDFQEFQQYAHENPHALQKFIKLFLNSVFYLQDKGGHPFWISLRTAADVFCSYFRETHNEEETRQKHNCLIQAIDYARNISDAYVEEFDSCNIIQQTLKRYLDQNIQIQIGNIDNIDGELTESIRCEEAILYDDNFYFIPEKILRCACEPFNDMTSILSIKRALHEEGYLCSNAVKEGNFTVKKTLINAYGQCFRPRFLRIKREFFESAESLGLQERRTKCIVEI